MSAVPERRKERRLDLDLHVEFTEAATPDASAPLKGRTRNVSAGGLFFETANPLAAGAELLLDVAIPNRPGEAADPLALHCEGQVLRVVRLAGTSAGERFGVAVKFSNRPNIESQFLSHLLWERE